MSISTNFPAIKPSLMLDFANTGSLDPRVSFARASTGTYYDGVTTAMAEQNLLLRSQEFDNAVWVKNNVTVTENSTTAPDSTATADTVTEDTATANHQFYQAVVFTSNPTTYSVYIKANGCNTVDVYFRTGTTGTVSSHFNYNLSTVTASVTSGISASATITDVGNGWYRITGTSSSNSASTVAILRLTRLGSSYTGDGISGVYLWGAQLEERSAVSSYTATTTQPIVNYIPVLQTAAANVARFDHNPTTGEALGLLIEEQRTNLLTYSSEFSNAAWTKSNATVTTNTVVAPDGTLTGDKLVEDTNTGGHGVYRGFVYSAITYTYSIRAKAAERTKLRLVAAGSSGVLTNVDLGAGTIDSGAAFGSGWTVVGTSIQNIGNGFYVASITFTAAAESGSLQINLLDASGNNSYTGNGYSGIFIWGAQLEAGAFPTSAIATTSAQVTRSADAASMTGTNFSSWYNQGEGALYSSYDVIGYNPAAASSFPVNVSVSDGTSSNYIALLNTNYGSNLYGYPAASVAGIAQYSMYGGTVVSFSINTLVQACVSYAVNNALYSVNGLAAQSDTTCLVPIVNKLNIGVGASGSLSFINGHIRKISYYPQALTAANLQALTS